MSFIIYAIKKKNSIRHVFFVIDQNSNEAVKLTCSHNMHNLRCNNTALPRRKEVMTNIFKIHFLA